MIPSNKTPSDYRLLRTTSSEAPSLVRPVHVFNVEDLLSGFCSTLWCVRTGYGYESYPDYVCAPNEQDALDILADAVDATEKLMTGKDGMVQLQVRQSRPWLGGALVRDADADADRLSEDSDNPYDSLGDGCYRYDLENVSIHQVPFQIHIEILDAKFI